MSGLFLNSKIPRSNRKSTGAVMTNDQKERILMSLADVERISHRLKSTFAQDLSPLTQIEQDAIIATGIENMLIATGNFISMVGMSQVLNPAKYHN